MSRSQHRPNGFFRDFLGVDIDQVQTQVAGNAAMHERFVEAFIGVPLIDILSNKGNGNFINWLFVGFHNIYPILKLGASCPHLQQLNDFVIKLLLVID